MLIFEIVPPVLVGVFMAATVVAALVHRISGNNQKITLTFLGVVGLVLWLGNEPWSEPFPGAIKAVVILSTFFQIVLAGLAYWVRKPSQKG
jgi:hypothetical protein